MSVQSAIEWTDTTWNPVRGCTKVSPGCAHCYAETFAERFRGVKGHPYEQGFDLRLVPEKLTEPLTWKKPRRVFVNSMSDLFQEGVPDSFVDQVFAVMAFTPRHTYQVLTKRADRMHAYFEAQGDYTEEWYRRVFAIHRRWRDEGVFRLPSDYDGQYAIGRSIGALTCGSHRRRFLPNVWLGVSVENQHFADERISLLLDTPAAVRFISAEPLLEDVSLYAFLKTPQRDECLGILNHTGRTDAPGLDWVIVGGESGHGARPFNIAWARSLVSQCAAAVTPVFVKQLGANPVIVCPICSGNSEGDECGRCLGCHLQTVFTSKKGGDMAEWPEDLRVREFPAQ